MTYKMSSHPRMRATMASLAFSALVLSCSGTDADEEGTVRAESTGPVESSVEACQRGAIIPGGTADGNYGDAAVAQFVMPHDLRRGAENGGELSESNVILWSNELGYVYEVQGLGSAARAATGGIVAGLIHVGVPSAPVANAEVLSEIDSVLVTMIGPGRAVDSESATVLIDGTAVEPASMLETSSGDVVDVFLVVMPAIAQPCIPIEYRIGEVLYAGEVALGVDQDVAWDESGLTPGLGAGRKAE